MSNDRNLDNPYYTPGAESRPIMATLFDTEVVPPPPSDAWVVDNLEGKPLPEAEAIVYILAFARSRPFYIAVGDDLGTAYSVRNAIHDEQEMRNGKGRITPMICVYLECLASKAAAQARCAEIKAMPHAWQRRLIDRFNVWWINVDSVVIGYPFIKSGVGEHGMMPLTELRRILFPESLPPDTPSHD